MSVESLRIEAVAARRALDRRAGEARSVATEGKARAEEVASLRGRVEALDEAIAVLSSYADSREAELNAKIEALVTEGLRTVFGDDLSFHIETKVKGKTTTSEFLIRSRVGDEVVETDILSARGGGVAAVAGFLLRLILLLLRDDAEPVLFLDETFAQLSAEYEPALAEFMRELVDRTPAQLIMVTHSTAYDDVADTAYRFRLEDGETKVERVG